MPSRLGSADSAEEPVERRIRRASIVEGNQCPIIANNAASATRAGRISGTGACAGDRSIQRFSQTLKCEGLAEKSVDLYSRRARNRRFPHPCANQNGDFGSNLRQALGQLFPAHLWHGPVRDHGIEGVGSSAEGRQGCGPAPASSDSVTKAYKK